MSGAAKDAGPPHDPKNGQFTSGQHSEQAAHHKEKQAYHEAEAKKHGESSTSAYGSHGNAGSHHYSAAFYHEKAATDPERYAEQAHKNSKIATQASAKIEKAGASYKTPESKPREEKTPLTAQQQSAERIARHLSENRIRLRSGRGRDSALVVGDSKRGTATMPTTAKLSPTAVYAMGVLSNYVTPRLAQDAKIDLKSILLGTTARNIGDRAGKIARDVKRAVRGRLAQDADVDDVEEVIDAIQEMAPEIAEAASEPDQQDLEAIKDPEDDQSGDSPEMMAKAMEFLKDKLSPEDLNAFTEMMGHEDVVDPAEDNEEESEEDRMKREKEAEDTDDGTPQPGAMDGKGFRRAVRLAVDAALDSERQNQRELREAERFVRPLVGELGVACDSAEQVYAHALEMRGVSKDKIKGLGAQGCRTLLEVMQTAAPRRSPRTEPALGEDSKPTGGSFRERFKDAGRIRLMG